MPFCWRYWSPIQQDNFFCIPERKLHHWQVEASHQEGKVVVLEVLRVPSVHPSNGDPQQVVARLTHHVASHLLQLSSPLGAYRKPKFHIFHQLYFNRTLLWQVF